MGDVPTFASRGEALGMLHASLRFLAADPAEMAVEAQAECLRGLEQADAMSIAARAGILGAFTASGGHGEDADYSPAAWLMHRTRVTRYAARAHVGWSRRAAAHPLVAAVMAGGGLVSESYGRAICGWTDKLPQDCRAAADAILVGAARAGAGLPDLAGLAAEMYARSRPACGEDDGGFEDRAVRLETTFDGAGVLAGDLTPECAAVVTAVLDALSAPAGAEDTRTHEQRYHDALAEAMRRLIAAGLLPERAGQPVKAVMHVSLAELRGWDGDSLLEGEWVTVVQARWAGYRAAASAGGSDGGAWLTGDAARAVTCDARMATYVDGNVDLGALEDLVRLCASLDRLDRLDDPQGPCAPLPCSTSSGEPVPPAGPVPAGLLSRRALQRAIIGKAVDLVSGPGGLASFLRTRELGGPLAGPGLPLDIGFSDTIPAGIRNAVIWRDQHCRWAGGCDQPAAACEVHHTKHKANGGKTSTKDCVLLCFFHHQIAIHRWGWTLVLNPDGTTTAWNKDRTKVLHSHGPPARAG